MERKETEKLELRSEKVRNIIGRVPPSIIRNGIGILSILFVLLMGALCLIPYPETVDADAEVVTTAAGTRVRVALPYSLVVQIDRTVSARIAFEGYDVKQYGRVGAVVCNINKRPVRRKGKNSFVVEMKIDECPGGVSLYDGMKGKASLLLSRSTFAEKVFQRALF